MAYDHCTTDSGGVPFDTWMTTVSFLLRKEFEVDLGDLPDPGWADYHAVGNTPRGAVRQFLINYGSDSLAFGETKATGLPFGEWLVRVNFLLLLTAGQTTRDFRGRDWKLFYDWNNSPRATALYAAA